MFESHLKYTEMRETVKYKYGKTDEYQSKKKMMYLRGTKVGSNTGRQTWFEEA